MSWWYARPDVNELRTVMILPGHLGEGAEATTRVEASYRPPVDHVWSTIGGADYYLTGAADAVDRLGERLRDWSTRWADA
jgi:hypothetical protein